MDHLHFYIASIVTFLSSIINVLIVGLFSGKATRKEVKTHYILYALALSLWSLCVFLFSSVKNKQLSFFFLQLLHFGAIFIPIFWFDFNRIFFRLKGKFISTELFFYYVASVIFLLINFFLPRYFIQDMAPKGAFPYFMVPGPLYIYWIFLFIVITTSAHIRMYKFYKQSKGLERAQLKLFFFSSFIGYLGAVGYFMPVYDQFYFPYPYGCYGAAMFAISAAIAIVKYRLMDIEVIIKKTLVFAGVFGMVMAIISLVTTISQSVIGKYVQVPTTVSTAISMLLAIFLYDPTRKLLIAATDKFLFQKKEDIRVILNRLSKEIITILDLREVGHKVLSTLEDTLRLEAGELIIRNDKTLRYETLKSFGTGDEWTSWTESDALIQYFSKRPDIFNVEDTNTREKLPEDLRIQLLSLKASIVIPLVFQNALLGLLILGKKKSDQDYDSQELDYFPTIASQIAIAVSNAKLLEEVVTERESKFKAEKEAEMVSYAKTIAHEIKNALVGIANPAMFLTQHQLVDLRSIYDKFIKDQAPEIAQKKYLDICSKIEKHGQTIKNSAEKIRVIAKTAEGTLKNDQASKEELYFRIVWDEAKSDSRVKDVAITSKMPENFVLYGNLVLLQRVFVNLITNAREAMKPEQAEKTIHLECTYKEIDGKKVTHFEFRDNGPGIPKEIQAKIFEQGFSTKPKPKKGDINASGYGQGLYVIKKTIEDFHGGKLTLESEPGKGTAFIFWIPAEEQAALA